MGNIIASQLHMNTEQIFSGALVMCAISLLCAWATFTSIKNGFKKGFHSDDITMNIFAIVITIAFVVGANVLINNSQTQQNEYNTVKQATSKVPYYNIKKDGVLIIAEKKSDAPAWLIDKVETKIISEDETSYQVQFKDQYARVNKKDLK
jgi:hypothetical protein